jgi:glycosyltransferase involved in cell wall biosynthesis
MCLRAADGLICSTEYLAKRYRSFNKRAWVAENGIDLARYRLTRLERETCSVGWAGATGHLGSLMDWLSAVATLMLDHEHVNFVSVGQPGLAEAFGERFGQKRALGVPFTLIENYPAAMSLFDIALAPAGRTAWYKAKSDLRQLEAGALGIPVIADPVVYPNIEHGVTGFHAETPDEVLEILRVLVDDRGLRQDVGRAAKDYVEENRDISKICRRWLEVAAMAVAGLDPEAVVA